MLPWDSGQLLTNKVKNAAVKLLIQYIVNRWQVQDRTIQQHTDSRRETNTEVVCIQGTQINSNTIETVEKDM